MSNAVKIITAMALALVAGPAIAQEAAATGDALYLINTLFLALSAVLVMWMAAGFAMLEAGFVRSKNAAMQCAKNIGLFAISGLAFTLVGYELMFPGESWIIPGLLGIPGPANLSETHQAAASPAIVFMFQLMFCAATASIVSGALAERVRIVPFFVFVIILGMLIYPISASWVWGGGFLSETIGFKDFAGGTLVHSVGGWAALAGVLVVGARHGRFSNGNITPMPGSNLPLILLGVLILWMGWFGFNAGSNLSFATAEDANNVGRIFANTNAAAAAGVIASMVITRFLFGKIDLTISMNGALAGLVSITAEPLAPSVGLALLIGAAGGAIATGAILMMDKLRLDDVVGAIPVHLCCGIWGTLAVVLSNPEANIISQATGIVIIGGFAFGASLAAFVAISAITKLRASVEDQTSGLDIADLGLIAYPEFAMDED